MPERADLPADLLAAAALLVLTAAIWMHAHDRLTPTAWQTPLTYANDVPKVLAVIKAFAIGAIVPIAPKFVPGLGAPEGANWNDWPIVEEPVFAVAGLLSGGFGLAAGANLAVLLAHLLAAGSFFGASRMLGARRPFAFGLAVLFANAPFLYRRSLVHLPVTHCWHVPLCVLVVLWALSPTGLARSRGRLGFAVGVAVVTGSLHVYYASMFLQFLGLAVAVAAVRRDWPAARVAIVVALAVVAGFLLVNVDTLAFAWRHGWNSDAVVRSIAALENLALKPLDLFIPAGHRWQAAQRFLWERYFSQVVVRGDIGSAYLGVIGGVALLALAGRTVIGLVRANAGPPAEAGLVAWILAFSVVGGVNSALGVAGFTYLRASNRFSIFILALALFFLATTLSRRCPRRYVLPLAAAIVGVGLWDQVPSRAARSSIQEVRARFEDDRRFAERLEALLPDGAIVLQLPVMAFPETRGPGGMESYDHLRPFLFSRTLRFTFGTHKGRGHERWQERLAALSPAVFVPEAVALGVDAVLIDLHGYPDGAPGLVDELGRTAPGLRNGRGNLVAWRLPGGRGGPVPERPAVATPEAPP